MNWPNDPLIDAKFCKHKLTRTIIKHKTEECTHRNYNIKKKNP